jgi:hypothetical protein
MKTKLKPPGETPGSAGAGTAAATKGDWALMRGARLLPLREWEEGQRFELAMARWEDRERFSAFVLGVL